MPFSGFTSDNVYNGPYLKYGVESEYTWEANVLSLPVAYSTGSSQSAAGPGYALPMNQRQAAEIFPTSAPHGFRVVRWDLVRWGAVPDMPNPEPEDPNETLVRAKFWNLNPVPQPDGESTIYIMRGMAVYALSQPPWPRTDPLRSGSSPAIQDGANAFSTDPSQYLDGLK